MSTNDSAPGMLEAELRARVANARGSYDEAIWRLALGDADTGHEALRAALPGLAPHAADGIRVAHVALLAGEAVVARAAADAALDAAVGRYLPGDREYH